MSITIFKQLYNLDPIEKSIQNIGKVTHKLEQTLIRPTNYRLEIAKKEK